MSSATNEERDRLQQEYNRLTRALQQYPDRSDIRPLVLQRRRQALAEALARSATLDADPLRDVTSAVLWVQQRAELRRRERDRRRNEWRARLTVAGGGLLCLAIVALLWVAQ